MRTLKKERDERNEEAQAPWNYITRYNRLYDKDFLTDKEPNKRPKSGKRWLHTKSQDKRPLEDGFQYFTRPVGLMSLPPIDTFISNKKEFEPDYLQKKPFKPVTKHGRIFEKVKFDDPPKDPMIQSEQNDAKDSARVSNREVDPKKYLETEDMQQFTQR
eukprot:TRINITY_DN4098_c0_g1_i1.p3 TRINITY_DN4098_c0_g1~~TRINITY_DN4098_c0_g1_i1.p3  ORF type:complete len:159 (-),score=33.47 TRINITY_DN4098_c0_g1_i1:14-490(-)